MKWAFSDESRRGGTYVVAAVVVETRDVAATRAELRRFLRSNQRRVHMVKESQARRSQFLGLVERVTLSAIVVEVTIGTLSTDHARASALGAMARLLVAEGVGLWHLEWMVEDVERSDRKAIRTALSGVDPPSELLYDHRPPHGEPLLWAADAVAWAASRQRLAWATTSTLP